MELITFLTTEGILIQHIGDAGYMTTRKMQEKYLGNLNSRPFRIIELIIGQEYSSTPAPGQNRMADEKKPQVTG